MQFRGAEFFGDQDVQMMDNATLGGYLRLRWCQWTEGGLRDNPTGLAQLARVTPEQMATLLPLFPLSPDGLRRHIALAAERDEVVTKMRTRSTAASHGWDKRMQSESKCNATASGMQEECTVSLSSSAVICSSVVSPEGESEGKPTRSRNETAVRNGLADFPDAVETVVQSCRTHRDPPAIWTAVRAVCPGGIHEPSGGVTWADVAGAIIAQAGSSGSFQAHKLAGWVLTERQKRLEGPPAPRQRTNAAEGHSGPVGKWNRLEAAAKAAEGASS